MNSIRISLLLGLSACLIAETAFMQSAHASEPAPVASADTTMKLEFHPIRASAASKRNGGDLKPDIDSAEFLPIDAELRVHVHADGSVSYDCNETHGADKHSPAKPESRS